MKQKGFSSQIFGIFASHCAHCHCACNPKSQCLPIHSWSPTTLLPSWSRNLSKSIPSFISKYFRTSFRRAPICPTKLLHLLERLYHHQIYTNTIWCCFEILWGYQGQVSDCEEACTSSSKASSSQTYSQGCYFCLRICETCSTTCQKGNHLFGQRYRGRDIKERKRKRPEAAVTVKLEAAPAFKKVKTSVALPEDDEAVPSEAVADVEDKVSTVEEELDVTPVVKPES